MMNLTDSGEPALVCQQQVGVPTCRSTLYGMDYQLIFNLCPKCSEMSKFVTSFKHFFSMCFLFILHLPLWGMECTMGNRFDHVDSHGSHMKHRFLCHKLITFRAMIRYLGCIQRGEKIHFVHSQKIFF